MTLEELRVEKVTFGKAHVGKTFQELPTEIKCLTWFTETFRHSRKPEHSKLLRFVQLHLESLEMEDPVVPTCSDLSLEAQGQSQDATWGPMISIDQELEEDVDSGSDPQGRPPDESPSPGPHVPDGNRDARSSGTSEAHSPGKSESKLSQIANFMMRAELCEAWQDIHMSMSIDREDVFGDKDVGITVFIPGKPIG